MLVKKVKDEGSAAFSIGVSDSESDEEEGQIIARTAPAPNTHKTKKDSKDSNELRKAIKIGIRVSVYFLKPC